jgi:uncharacterized caspase-like protein
MRSSCAFVVLFLFAARFAQGYPLHNLQDVSAAGPLTVKLTVNHPQCVYVEGETLRVSVTTNKDCYLRLVYRDAQGESVVIFPNYKHRDDKVKGGVEWLVPTLFEASPPFGKEILHAFVSSEKFPTLEGGDRGDGLFRAHDSLGIIIGRLRTGAIFGEYAEHNLVIVTKARGNTSDTVAPAQPELPQLEFTKPGPSEYAVERSDSVLIEGLVRGKNILRSVTINGVPARVRDAGKDLRFALKVRLSNGENKFEIVTVSKDSRSVSRTMIVRKDERRFEGQRWAVVVGVSDYENPTIPDLKYAHRDAEAFYDFLKSPNGGAFADDHMLLLTNEKATTANVRSAMFDFLKQSRKEDLVMVYFSGHGLSRGRGFSYFVTHDTDPSRIEETGFNMEDIQIALRKSIRAERVIIFADACQSGAVNQFVGQTRSTQVEKNLINRYLVEMGKTKPGVLSFTSCAENEVSGEAYLFWEHGIFTFVLISGLGGKVTDSNGRVKAFESADLNEDGIITVGELSQYVKRFVPGYTKNKQNPQISKSEFDPNTPLSVIR